MSSKFSVDSGPRIQWGLLPKVSPICFIKQKNLIFHLMGYTFSPAVELFAVSFHLNKIYSEWKPDLIHVHGGRAGLFHTITGTTVPTVYTVHGFHFVHKPIGIRWLATFIEGVIISRANRIIFESEYDANLAMTTQDSSGKPNRPPLYHNSIQLRNTSRRPHNSGQACGIFRSVRVPKDPFLVSGCVRTLALITLRRWQGRRALNLL